MSFHPEHAPSQIALRELGQTVRTSDPRHESARVLKALVSGTADDAAIQAIVTEHVRSAPHSAEQISQLLEAAVARGAGTPARRDQA